MRITGYVLMALGLIAGLIFVISMGREPSPAMEATSVSRDEAPRMSMVLPLLGCAAITVVGGLMALYGGRGYFISNNPRVRN